MGLENVATVDGPEDPNPDNDRAADPTDIITQADMTIVKDVEAGPWVAGTEVQYVVVQSLHIQTNAQVPDQIDYGLWLAESPPPPPPPSNSLLDGIDAGLLDEAGGLLDDVMGAVDALSALGNVPELSDPTPPLKDTLGDVAATMDELGGAGAAITGLFG